MQEPTEIVLSPSERVLRAAAHLLETSGVDAVSTRAVATAAGIQPPTLYRQFGDKDGLLDALAAFVLQQYLSNKRQLITASDDPVADLRTLWDQHVEFGLTHPDGYQLCYGRGHPERMRPAAEETVALLRTTISRLADHGALRMSVERATQLFHSCGVGLVMTQIPIPAAKRDPRLSAIARENALAAIATSVQPSEVLTTDIASRAVALQESLRDQDASPLTNAEQHLLAEWLGRLADRDAQCDGENLV
ncbi:TetR/AcrR family transcriptional regulator [soil metagenome]